MRQSILFALFLALSAPAAIWGVSKMTLWFIRDLRGDPREEE